MSFEDLPDHIIGEILCRLMDDPKSFVIFSSCCKRFTKLAEDIPIHKKEKWILKRPLAFDMYQELGRYKPQLCTVHGYCPEGKTRTGYNCELQSLSLSGSNRDKPNEAESRRPRQTMLRARVGPQLVEDGQEENSHQDKCYYHRLYCLLNTNYRSFSTIRFKSACLSDRGCMRAFRDSLNANKLLTEHRLTALVELELCKCDITLDWLNTILDAMRHVQYLNLNSNCFRDSSILVEPRHLASKKLKQLKITGDRSITDLLFMYFLENFPTQELDLTGTRIEYHKRIIQRFYMGPNIEPPSEYIFSFRMVLAYLKKYQAVIQHFIADETEINFTSLKRIVQDEDLKQLKITVKNCPQIIPARFEQARMAEEMEFNDWTRVVF